MVYLRDGTAIELDTCTHNINWAQERFILEAWQWAQRGVPMVHPLDMPQWLTTALHWLMQWQAEEIEAKLAEQARGYNRP